ncbi:unnamed protein product [Bursaphelenchus okinawaensis]|uniref:Uncharacterized protein n=1 Tax=Bursaphelenchus okinawaensis TaxID=465554 RepID=A0A811JRP6_9BILA|nr:unnamed protein product [Bursaphelenchus okinawaensis]CAG9080051.1 unnamed protein product [Bursaphelenchus okinawaensis]
MATTSSTMILTRPVASENVDLHDPVEDFLNSPFDEEETAVEYLCLHQFNALKRFPEDFDEKKAFYPTIFNEIQRLFIRVSNLNVVKDPSKSSEFSAVMFYWLHFVQKVTLKIYEVNQKSFAKIVNLALNGLVFQLAQQDYKEYERCTTILVNLLPSLEGYTEYEQLFLAIHNIVVKKKKKGKQLYFEWSKNCNKELGILVLELLWKICELGMDAWKQELQLDILEVVNLMKFSFETKSERIFNVCASTLSKLIKNSSYDIFVHFREVFSLIGLQSQHPLVLSVTPGIMRRFACFQPMEPLGLEVLKVVLENKDTVTDLHYEVLFEFVKNSYFSISEEKLEQLLVLLCKNLDETLESPARFKLFNLFFSLKDVRVPMPINFAIKSVLPRQNEFKKDPVIRRLFVQLRSLCHLALPQRERLLKVAGASLKPRAKAQSKFSVLKPGFGSLLSDTYLQAKQNAINDQIVDEKEEIELIQVEDEVVLSSDGEDVKIVDVKRKKSDDVVVISEKRPKLDKISDLDRKMVDLQLSVDGDTKVEVAIPDSPGSYDDEGAETEHEEEGDDEIVTFLDLEMPKRKAKEVFKAVFGTTRTVPSLMKRPIEPLECEQIFGDTSVNIMEGQPNREAMKKWKEVTDPVNAEKEFSAMAKKFKVREEELMGEYDCDDEDDDEAERIAEEIAEMFKNQFGLP